MDEISNEKSKTDNNNNNMRPNFSLPPLNAPVHVNNDKILCNIRLIIQAFHLKTQATKFILNHRSTTVFYCFE
jgi:hypothetical protein